MKRNIPVLTVPRGIGTTSWILVSALTNPDVILVFKDEVQVYEAKKRLTDIAMRNPSKFDFSERKTIVDHVNRISIETLDKYLERIDQYIKKKTPIIFDNSCYCRDGALIISK